MVIVTSKIIKRCIKKSESSPSTQSPFYSKVILTLRVHPSTAFSITIQTCTLTYSHMQNLIIENEMYCTYHPCNLVSWLLTASWTPLQVGREQQNIFLNSCIP